MKVIAPVAQQQDVAFIHAQGSRKWQALQAAFPDKMPSFGQIELRIHQNLSKPIRILLDNALLKCLMVEQYISNCLKILHCTYNCPIIGP